MVVLLLLQAPALGPAAAGAAAAGALLPPLGLGALAGPLSSQQGLPPQPLLGAGCRMRGASGVRCTPQRAERRARWRRGLPNRFHTRSEIAMAQVADVGMSQAAVVGTGCPVLL